MAYYLMLQAKLSKYGRNFTVLIASAEIKDSFGYESRRRDEKPPVIDGDKCM